MLFKKMANRNGISSGSMCYYCNIKIKRKLDRLKTFLRPQQSVEFSFPHPLYVRPGKSHMIQLSEALKAPKNNNSFTTSLAILSLIFAGTPKGRGHLEEAQSFPFHLRRCSNCHSCTLLCKIVVYLVYVFVIFVFICMFTRMNMFMCIYKCICFCICLCI